MLCALALLNASPALAQLASPGSPALALFGGAHDGRVDVSGREFVYDSKNDTFTVRGQAQVGRGASLLKGDEISFARRQNVATASGNVRFTDPETTLTASHAELDIDDETGKLSDAKLSAAHGSYYVAGREVTKQLGQNYIVKDGYFTTCGCASALPAWSVSGKRLDVHLGGEGIVRHARFNILGHPVLDIPYAVFPANSDRQTGLLTPRIGQSHRRGLQYLQPFFINIDKSQDATVALDVETEARIGALGEYRIRNGPDDWLRFTTGFFDESIRKDRTRDIVDREISDPHIPVNRYGLLGGMRQHLSPDLTAYADTVSVSDSLYLREINAHQLSRGYGTDLTLLRSADSHFGLIRSFDNSFLRVSGTWTQDLIQDQDFTLQKLPEILLSGRRQLFGGLAYTDYDVQAVNYWRTKGIQGDRLDINPSLVVPWRLRDYVSGYARLGARETIYDVSGHNLDVTPPQVAGGLRYNNSLALGELGRGGLRDRQLIYGSFAASTVLSRIYDLNWHALRRIKHTIEPTVSYDYVPVVNQRDLPRFDEVDRVNGRSLLTYGVTSRIFGQFGPALEGGQQAGEEKDDSRGGGFGPGGTNSVAGGSQVRELARLSLLQAYDTLRSVTGNSGTRLSDVEASASLFPTDLASFGSQVGYNPNKRQISNADVYFSVRPPWEAHIKQRLSMGRAMIGGSFLQLGYNFVHGRVSTNGLFIRAYYELFNRIGVYYAPSYDLAAGKLLSTEYGLRIKSSCDCWAADLGVTDTVNPNEVQFQLQLTLGGVGSFGGNPFGRNPFVRSNGPGVLTSTQY